MRAAATPARRGFATLTTSLVSDSSAAAAGAARSGYPAWLEIDMHALAHNMSVIRSVAPPGAIICGVVKGNAYGHGAPAIAHEVLRLGATRLAVATVDEGAEVRESLACAIRSAPMHLLGPAHPAELRAAREQQLIPTICTREAGRGWAELDREGGERLPVFVKVDTGMHRAGVACEELAEFVAELEGQGVWVEGVITHFARADEDELFTQMQLENFNRATAGLGQKSYLLSCANSAGTLRLGLTGGSSSWMVRPGMALYGLPPSDHFLSFGLKPLMRLRAKPNMLKTVRKGGSVGYGSSYVAEQDIRIAVLPVGYADGLDRGLSNRGWIRLGGAGSAPEYCPIIGRISMDEVTIRIDQLRCVDDVNLDTLFDVITPDVDSRTSLTGWAKMLGTINYEVATGISHRLPRIYIKDENIRQVNYWAT